MHIPASIIPKKEALLPMICPIVRNTFDLPDYYLIDTRVTYFNEKPDDPCWVNLVCSDQNPTIYLS
ncbi:MAG: hypothetical protein R2794_09910 [Chitinophagales bacterium]